MLQTNTVVIGKDPGMRNEEVQCSYVFVNLFGELVKTKERSMVKHPMKSDFDRLQRFSTAQTQIAVQENSRNDFLGEPKIEITKSMQTK
jgi:hypothetical protein